MKDICATNYEEIKEIANHYKVSAEDEIFFRGTSNSLVPSIVEKCSFKTYADLVAKEHFLLGDFINYSHLKYEFKESVPKDWEIRIAAREHGIASSLMDWSNSLNSSLEFAIHNFENKKIDFTSLWILNKSKINQITVSAEMNNENSFQVINSPSIIQFTKYNEASYLRRRFIQGGYFLFQSPQEVTIPLEKNPFFSELLVHIIIPKNVVPEIWKHISSKVNIDFDVCPSFGNSDTALDEICMQLNKKYRL